MNGIEELEEASRLDDQVWYVAHPVHPTPEEVDAILAQPELPRSDGQVTSTEARINFAKFIQVRGNIINGKRWLKWLSFRFPTITFVAPWIAAIDGGGGNDLDPALRSMGIRDCCRTVKRCDGIIHVGGRVSSGMREEAAIAARTIDLTHLGRMPPLTEEAEAGLKAVWSDGSHLPGAIGPLTDVTDQPPPTPRDDQVRVWEVVISEMTTMRDDMESDDCVARVVDQVIAEMRHRDQIGRQRYGTPLTAHNGRNQRVDLYQELLDAAAYARADLIESASIDGFSVYRSILANLVLVRRMISDRAGS